jgi:flagellar biosynthetic protein FliR
MVIISVAQAQMFFLALTRVIAILSRLPVLGGQVIPTSVRISLGILLTAVLPIWPASLSETTQAIALLPFAVAILRELIIGLTAGLALDLTFGALQAAGEMLGLGSGFAASRYLNPLVGDSGSILDQFFLMVATLIFLIINGHHTVLVALAQTFTLLPLNSTLSGLPLEEILRTATLLMLNGVQIALPVFGALLLADLALGLLARTAPQIQVFFLGLPLKIAASLLILAMSLAYTLPSLVGLLEQAGPRMLRLLGG